MWSGHDPHARRTRVRAAVDDGAGVRRLHRGRSVAARHRSPLDRCRRTETARPRRGRCGSTYMNDVAQVIPRREAATEPRPRLAARRRPPTPARRWRRPPAGGRGEVVTSLTERLGAAEPPAPQSVGELVRDGLAKRISGAAEFARRRVAGDYPIDEFGFDAHLLENVILPTLRPLSEHWFRVQVEGIGNIPAEGGALIVANHAGTVPVDGLMLQLAVHDNHPARRALRLLAADLIFEMP